jgi:cytochrome P450
LTFPPPPLPQLQVVHAMQNKRREFSKSKLRKETAGLVLGEGLLLSEGDKHARNRKVLRPSFEGSSLAKFIGTMESCCQGVEKAISKAVDDDEASGGGGVAEVDMSELVQEATLLMVTQCLFTSRSAGDGKRLKKWIGDAFRYTSILQKSNFRGLRLLLGNLGVGKSHRSFKSALGEMDKYVLDLVSNRRIGIEKEGQRVDDMLDMLLRTRFEGGDGFTDREIRDELVVMLLAGHDTSALALMWAFNFLAEYPEYAEAVYQETLRVLGPPNDEGKWADFTVESVMQMPETDRILKEVMRLRPPVFEVRLKTVFVGSFPCIGN